MDNKMMKGKKGFSINDLSTIGIVFVTTAIIIAIGATILASVQSTQTSGTVAFNASGYGLTSLNTLGSYLPTVALVAVAAVIIGIILLFFGRKSG